MQYIKSPKAALKIETIHKYYHTWLREDFLPILLLGVPRASYISESVDSLWH